MPALAFLIFCCTLLDRPAISPPANPAPPMRVTETPRQISASLDLSISGNRIFWTVNVKDDRLAYEFSAEEADFVKTALRGERTPLWWAGLFHYLADSMAWWEAGQGEKLKQSGGIREY